jgi:hypothetical protein
LQGADVLFVLSTVDAAEFIKDVLSTDKDVGVCLSIDVLDIRYPCPTRKIGRLAPLNHFAICFKEILQCIFHKVLCRYYNASGGVSVSRSAFLCAIGT